MKITATILKVFADLEGQFGNAVGIIQDEGQTLSVEKRQAIAISLGFSESVFINDLSTRSISIYTPQNEIPFAGHAAVGVARGISDITGEKVTTLQGLEGEIAVWSEENLIWVRSELKSTPPWWHERLEDPDELLGLKGPLNDNQIHTQLWAWLDEEKGLIRSRTFADGWGIPEDEANGSGCMRLAAALGRRIKVIHGKGSIIHAKPGNPGFADVGGLVVHSGEQIVDY